MRMWIVRAVGCVIGTIAIMDLAVAAPISAVNMPAQTCYLGPSTQNQIQGFSFTPTVNLTVTSLGVADCNMDGLSIDTPVGLYRGDGTLMVGTDLSAGIGDTLEGTLRFTDVSPVTLLQGVEYRILSFMEHDIGEAALLSNNATFASQLIFNGFLALQDGGVHANLPGLQFIGSPFCCTLMGPSFKFEAAVTGVPSPGSLALMSLGLLGYFFVTYRFNCNR
jgi:hypothetical protein